MNAGGENEVHHCRLQTDSDNWLKTLKKTVPLVAPALLLHVLTLPWRQLPMLNHLKQRATTVLDLGPALHL